MKLVTGLSPRRSEFDASLVEEGFVVDKAALEQASRQVLQFYPFEDYITDTPYVIHLSTSLNHFYNDGVVK
jgi:hypothetical protein